MKLYILVILWCLIAVGVFGAWSNTLSVLGKAESIAFPNVNICEFGSIEKGEELVAKFLIHNPKPKRLVLNEKPQDCSCDSIATATWIIPAYGSKSIEIRRGTTNLEGTIELEVVYESSDPLCPEKTYLLRGNVVAKHE